MRQKITLEFNREDETVTDEREKEKMTIRKLLLGSCKLLDVKNEKNGTYDIAPPAGEKYFDCDNMKGGANGGQEVTMKFTFKPPQIDPIIKDISVLKGVG